MSWGIGRRVILALALAASYVFFSQWNRAPLSDTDRYYHIALAKWSAQTGALFPKTFPQIKGLGWNERFPDKEAWFHFLTNIGYRISGESGVTAVALSFALAFLLAFFWYASYRIPPLAAAALAFILFFSFEFVLRFQFLRAFVPASLGAFLLHLGVLHGRKKLIAAGALLFGLVYHAYYLPVFCLLVAFFIALLEDRGGRRGLGILSFGLAGIGLGALLNPYFPDNLRIAYQVAQIPLLMDGALKDIVFGAELYPWLGNQFLYKLGGVLLLLLCGVLALGRAGLAPVRDRSHYQLFYLTVICGFFTILAMKTPRAVEYLVPASGLLAVVLAERFQERKKLVQAAMLLALLGGALQFAYRFQREFREEPDSRIAAVTRALAAIPEGETPSIFNCEWNMAPVVVNSDSRFQVLDILDPSLLYFADPEAFDAKYRFLKGQVPDAHFLMNKTFKADYVLCFTESAAAQMMYEPGFQLVYPAGPADLGDGKSLPFLFRVDKNKVPSFVQSWKVVPEPRATPGNYRTLLPPSHWVEAREEKTDGYLDLRRENESSTDDAKLYCAWAKPAPEETKRLSGSGYIGVGGGRTIRIWRNGRLFFETNGMVDTPRLITSLVGPEKKLTATDSWEALVCTTSARSQWGLALSFWSERDYEERCAWKKEKLAPEGKDELKSSFANLQSDHCLGELASEILPEEIRGLRQSLQSGWPVE